MESSRKINVVFWAESQEGVRDLASKFLSGKQSEEVYQDTFEGATVLGYTRAPNSVASASPSGITDILVVHISSESSEHVEAVKSYVDARRGIPFKFFVSDSDVSALAKSLEAEFVNSAEIENVKSKMFRSALDLEQTLREAFQKIDTDNDGFLEVAEIMSASQSLGHALNDEDAKEIVKSLSTDGKVSFEKFRQWWVMGRGDFGAFRRLVSIELAVHNMIKQSSDTFNTYLEKLKQEGQTLSTETTGLNGRINITPVEDFEAGTALNLHISAGNNFNDISASLPSYMNESPVSYGIELRLQNADEGKNVVETLTGLKEMLIPVIPGLQDILKSGINIQFRHVGSSVFIDVTLSGMAADKVSGILGLFNISALNFSGAHDVHVVSKLSPVDLTKIDFDAVLLSLVNLKIEGKAEYNHLRTVFTFIINTVSNLGVPSQVKPVLGALKLLATVRKVDIGFQYDPSTIKEVAIDWYNEKFGNPQNEVPRWERTCKEWTNDKQPQMNKNISTFASQAAMMLEPYKPAINALDFDNIGVFVSCPILKVHVKVNLQVRGLNGYVSSIIG
jgi:hypothetical protein